LLLVVLKPVDSEPSCEVTEPTDEDSEVSAVLVA